MKRGSLWMPAVVLWLGALVTVGIDGQSAMPLRTPLQESVPDELLGYDGTDLDISEAERRVAGMTDYLMRRYESPTQPAFSVYVGYYDQQTRGRTIHSPKNCLPGAGWNALRSTTIRLAGPDGDVTVNRYILQRDAERALVLYWYQGRGRVEASEYKVKLDLLRDAALRGRSDEALVRIVVPITEGERDAEDLARRIAEELLGPVDAALPA